MRKAMLVLVLGICCIGMIGRGWAAEEDSISVTVSLQSELSVSVTPNTWNIGPIALSGSSGPTSFTATVGNSATKLEIKGSDGAGGWAIGATTGEDQFVVAVASPAITLTTVFQQLAASVTAYGSQAFGLTYSAPTSDTKGAGASQNFTITLKASAP